LFSERATLQLPSSAGSISAGLAAALSVAGPA
jgi:hypothetical protein